MMITQFLLCFLWMRYVASFQVPLSGHPDAKLNTLHAADSRGDYYGKGDGSFMVKEFSTIDQLEEIVKLAAVPLPERPDGIITVAKFTSASPKSNARATEAEYERMARRNPATVFLRCFAEYDGAEMLFSTAQVTVIPTFDIFYSGNRVARVEGSNHAELEELLERYSFQNSNLDLFSEDSQKGLPRKRFPKDGSFNRDGYS